MKKLFLIACIISACSCAAQTVNGNRVVARQNLYLYDWWVDRIQRDTVFGLQSSLPTSKAVIDLVNGRSASMKYYVDSVAGTIAAAGGAVSSVYGRAGAITAQEADYQSFYPRFSQTYADPAWISQLAWGKITGVVLDYDSLIHKPSFPPSIYFDTTLTATNFGQTTHYNSIYIGKNSGLNTQFAPSLGSKGSSNTALGDYALKSLTTGYQNTAFGNDALQALTTGRFNTAIGKLALGATNGDDNIGIGQFTLASNTGSANAVVGNNAFQIKTTGDGNVGFGMYTGHDNLTGSRNVFLGYSAGYSETGSDKLYIENSNSASPLIYGDFTKDSAAINGTLSVRDVASGTTNDSALVWNATTKKVGYKAFPTGSAGINDVLAKNQQLAANQTIELGLNRFRLNSAPYGSYFDFNGAYNIQHLEDYGGDSKTEFMQQTSNEHVGNYARLYSYHNGNTGYGGNNIRETDFRVRPDGVHITGSGMIDSTTDKIFYYNTITGHVTYGDVPAGSVTVDATPTNGSSNAVASNGVYDALAAKADTGTAIINVLPPLRNVNDTTLGIDTVDAGAGVVTPAMKIGWDNKVDTIYRTPGKDSIQFYVNGRYHAIKDSTGGGGGGSGTVNSGTATQMAYYNATGTSVSGAAGVTWDGITFKTTRTKSSLYTLMGSNYVSDLTDGDNAEYIFGKRESTYDRFSMLYHHNADNSALNSMQFLFYGTSPLFTLQANGNITTVGKFFMGATNTGAGTTGNQTINTPTGTVNVAAGGSAVTVTNNYCATTSIVYAVIRTNDATATIKNVVPGTGTFTINLGAAATAETSIGFMIIN